MPTNVEEIESKKRHILNVFMKRKFHFFLFFTQKSEKNKKNCVWFPWLRAHDTKLRCFIE